MTRTPDRMRPPGEGRPRLRGQLDEDGGPMPTVVLSGEVDMASAEVMFELMDRAFADRERCSITIDLRAVTFMDSTGLSALAGAGSRARERDGTVVLRGVPRQVQRLLEVTCMVEHFDLADAADA